VYALTSGSNKIGKQYYFDDSYEEVNSCANVICSIDTILN
jgi:hypothetical protein